MFSTPRCHLQLRIGRLQLFVTSDCTHHRLLVRTGLVLVAGSLFFIGCNARETPRTPAAPNQAAASEAADAAVHQQLDPMFLTCGADLGREGQNFHMATYAICGSTGLLPDEQADYEPYRVFNASFAGLTLLQGETSDGATVLLAKAHAETLGMGPLPSQFTPEVEGLVPSTPGPGIEGGEVKALLVDPASAEQLLREPEESILYTQLTGFLQNGLIHVNGITPPTNAPAALTPAEVRLGVMALTLQGAINDAPSRWQLANPQQASQSPTGRPGSLEVLADLYGGLHAAGWVNPYTGAPMQNVPLNAPTPGDYTELADPTGVVILLHYRDINGGVSSRLIGNRKDAGQSAGREPMQST